MSHELRTPLNPARLLATAMMADESIPAAMRGDLEIIARGIALQTQLIDDLLDITRITGGKLRLNLKPIDTHAALQHAHEILVPDINGRGIKVEFDFKASDPFILADEVRLQQIFWNVLKNAVKFTPARGHVTVRTQNFGHDKLEVAVIDDGVGIEPEMLGKVFNAFVQEEHGHRFGGVGLGLAISRRLAELQNGRISVESQGRDKRSIFRIEFPLSKATVERSKASDSPGAAASVPRRILLVEDHEQTRDTVEKLLRQRGHEVNAVRATAAAREQVTRKKFDLIISDLGWPDGDGHTLMEDIRAGHALPGIALSGYGTDEDIALSRASGFSAHLTKPVSIGDLDAAIAGTLRDTVPNGN